MKGKLQSLAIAIAITAALFVVPLLIFFDGEARRREIEKERWLIRRNYIGINGPAEETYFSIGRPDSGFRGTTWTFLDESSNTKVILPANETLLKKL